MAARWGPQSMLVGETVGKIVVIATAMAFGVLVVGGVVGSVLGFELVGDVDGDMVGVLAAGDIVGGTARAVRWVLRRPATPWTMRSGPR